MSLLRSQLHDVGHPYGLRPIRRVSFTWSHCVFRIASVTPSLLRVYFPPPLSPPTHRPWSPQLSLFHSLGASISASNYVLDRTNFFSTPPANLSTPFASNIRHSFFIIGIHLRSSSTRHIFYRYFTPSVYVANRVYHIQSDRRTYPNSTKRRIPLFDTDT